MRIFLPLGLLFSCTTLFAQPTTPTENRELPRAEIMPYASAEAAAAGADNHRYGALIDTWALDGNTFSADFTVPFAWINRQVVVRIESASAPYEVLINGRRIAYNADPNTPSDFLVTKRVQEGRNHIEIKLADTSELQAIEGWKHPNDAPQLGCVRVFSSPTMGIREVVVRSSMSEEPQQANTEIGIVVKSYALNPRTVRIYYELLNPIGEPIAQGHSDLTLRMRGEDTVRFLATLPDTLLWSASKPQHHTLRLRTQQEGRFLEYHSLPLGLRAIAMHDGTLHINGKAVALNLATVAPNATPAELTELRKQGINALRLAPGAHREALYNYCDTTGLYLIAQAPIDSHHRGLSRQKGGNPSNDPAWQACYLERTANSYHTTKRHPSVIAFSLAHDSANGICLYESYLRLKAEQDDRAILYPAVAGEWNSDALK